MSTRRIRILVVDDSVVVAEGLKAQLEEYGFAVTTAYNSNEAFRTMNKFFCAKEPFQAILIDVNLRHNAPKGHWRGVSGMQLARMYRTIDHSAAIILMSLTPEVFKEDAATQVVDASVDKTTDIQNIRRIVEEAVRNRRSALIRKARLMESLQPVLPCGDRIITVQHSGGEDADKMLGYVSENSELRQISWAVYSSPGSDKVKVCLSCTHGCAIGCKFCESGRRQLKGKLSAEEMLGEAVHGILGSYQISGIWSKNQKLRVDWGCEGEPSTNIKNCLQVIRQLSPLKLGKKYLVWRFRINTVGLDLQEFVNQCQSNRLRDTEICLSLNFRPPYRENFMPGTRGQCLDKTRKQLRQIYEKTGTKWICSWMVAHNPSDKSAGNDNQADADFLKKFVDNEPCTIKLVPMMKRDQLIMPAFSTIDRDVENFRNLLLEKGASAERICIKSVLGTPFAAGCGSNIPRE